MMFVKWPLNGSESEGYLMTSVTNNIGTYILPPLPLLPPSPPRVPHLPPHSCAFPLPLIYLLYIKCCYVMFC